MHRLSSSGLDFTKFEFAALLTSADTFVVDVKKQKQKIPKRNNFISLRKMSFARKIVSSGLISKCMKSQNSTKFKFLQPQLLSVPNLRSMFIQTQDTPNPQSLKFLPGIKVS